MSLFNSNNYSCSAGVQACVSRCVCVCVCRGCWCVFLCLRESFITNQSVGVCRSLQGKSSPVCPTRSRSLEDSGRTSQATKKPQNTRDRQRSRCSPRLNSWIEVKPAEDGGKVWLTLIATAVIDFDDSSDDACLTRRGEAFCFQVSCELQQLTSLQEDL